MCGICGQVKFNGSPVDSNLVLSMRKSLLHRGPDDNGIWNENFDCGGVSLGHTRLSILDLSSAGHQPMQNSTGTCWITYNGEIYNYLEIKNELIKILYLSCLKISA